MVFGLDTGTGADDADCAADLNGGTVDTSTKSEYNCTTITINASPTISGTNALIIRATGAVIINADITMGTASIDGGDGAGGASTAGVAGPGGSNGGACATADCVANHDGLGTGKGLGGSNAADNAFGNSGGGGGGGGSYGTAGVNGSDGSDDLASTYSGGNAGATYGDETNFETSFPGGSGGGAAGTSVNYPPNSSVSGGAGGGGGGAFRIVAGGDITIATGVTISADGGDGGNDDGTDGAGGGGGSGGSVWLQSEGDLILSGTASVTALGGTGGASKKLGGAGGDGGKGRIRFDDSDGAVSFTGTVDPTPVIQVASVSSSGSTSSSNIIEYSSDITCQSQLDPEQVPISSFLQIIFSMFVSIFGIRLIKEIPQADLKRRSR